MRQVASLIGTYSSDEFGICSALYELGGMVVMHDASGCNSTYTTHDEPRWYEMESMIFISAISEMEAIMGDDEKLIKDLIETAEQLNPKFIAVVGAPIPYMIGTDLHAIAQMVEAATGIPSVGFEANGMHHYTKGISMAMKWLTKRFCIEAQEKTKEVSVNILGATPLDFSLNGSIDSIKEWIALQGMQVNSCMAMGSNLEEIKKASKAHINLVISYGGLEAAKDMEKRFHIPYVVGIPFGEAFPKELAGMLWKAKKEQKSFVAYEERSEKDSDFIFIGESVYGTSLAIAIEKEYGISIRVCHSLDTDASLVRNGDVITPDEDDIRKQVEGAKVVIADPMFLPLCQKGQAFYALPHEAFSGRIYDAVNPNLICKPLEKGEKLC